MGMGLQYVYWIWPACWYELSTNSIRNFDSLKTKESTWPAERQLAFLQVPEIQTSTLFSPTWKLLPYETC